MERVVYQMLRRFAIMIVTLILAGCPAPRTGYISRITRTTNIVSGVQSVRVEISFSDGTKQGLYLPDATGFNKSRRKLGDAVDAHLCAIDMDEIAPENSR